MCEINNLNTKNSFESEFHFGETKSFLFVTRVLLNNNLKLKIKK